MGDDAIAGFVMIIFRLVAVIFHKDLARWAIESQRQLFGRHMPGPGVGFTQVAYFIGGVAYLLGGIMAVIGVME